MRLGEHLIKKNAISKKVLEHCLNVQSRTNEKLGQILLHYNLISEEELAQVLATQAGVSISTSGFRRKATAAFSPKAAAVSFMA